MRQLEVKQSEHRQRLQQQAQQLEQLQQAQRAGECVCACRGVLLVEGREGAGTI